MLHSHRQKTHGRVIADGLALGADSNLLELEKLLELDLSIVDACDLGDAHDAANTTSETRLLDDEVDRGSDRLPDGPGGQVLAGLEDQRLEADQRFMRVVRVQRR